MGSVFSSDEESEGASGHSESAAAASQASAVPPPAPPRPADRSSARPPLAPARPPNRVTVEDSDGTSSLPSFERKVLQGRHKLSIMLLLGNHYPLQDHRFLHDYLRSFETEEQGLEASDKKLFDRNPTIKWKHFLICVDWLSIVQIQFSLNPEVLFLTVSLMVRVFSKAERQITLGKLQCLGVSALRVACKFEETTIHRVMDFSKITDSSSSCQDILEFEKLILETINFQISSVPTVFPFLCWYAERLTMSQRKIAYFWAEVSLLSSSVMASFRPSSIAAAATCMGLGKKWSDAMAKSCDYRYEELVPIMTAMSEFVDRIGPKRSKYLVFHKFDQLR